MRSSKEIVRQFEDVIDLFSRRVQRTWINKFYHYNLSNLFKIMRIIENMRDEQTRVVDVGAGPGIISLVLSRIGYDVTAIDVWTEFDANYDNWAGSTTEILRRFEENVVRYHNVDIERQTFPFEDETFDLALFMDVIEHLHHPKHTFLEINRVLASGGTLVLATPNATTLKKRVQILFGVSPYPRLDNWFNSVQYFGHIREYTMSEIRYMLHCTGFRILEESWSEHLLIPSKIKGTSDQYERTFKLNSVERFLAMAYMTITKMISSLRYSMVVVAQKAEHL